MVVRLRRHYAALLTGGAQLVLLVVGAQIGEPVGWVVVLSLVAGLSILAWIGTFRRWRAVADTPTSQVASAAQGYTELLGRAENHPGLRVLARLSQRPCCWCRYLSELRSGDRRQWRTVAEGETVESFLLRDTTGACTVDPDGAEVLTRHKRTWTEGDYRHTEWTLEEGDTLYALGEFVTSGGADLRLDASRETGELLGEWKRDRQDLLRRFDVDGDGEIDLREWGLARAAARREVERLHGELARLPGVDTLRKPADGRLYLLSNHDPRRLERRYYAWAWAHLGIFFAALTGAAIAARF